MSTTYARLLDSLSPPERGWRSAGRGTPLRPSWAAGCPSEGVTSRKLAHRVNYACTIDLTRVITLNMALVTRLAKLDKNWGGATQLTLSLSRSHSQYRVRSQIQLQNA